MCVCLSVCLSVRLLFCLLSCRRSVGGLSSGRALASLWLAWFLGALPTWRFGCGGLVASGAGGLWGWVWVGAWGGPGLASLVAWAPLAMELRPLWDQGVLEGSPDDSAPTCHMNTEDVGKQSHLE